MQRFNSKTSQSRKFFERKELDQIDLDSTTIEGKRYYWTPDGALYPSVTSVLGSNKDKKEGLQRWRNRVGLQEADRISRRTSNRGTQLHKICEDYLLNKENYFAKHMPLHIELFNHIRPILDESVEVIYGNELALFSHTLKTAGRTDMFCRFRGIDTIVDFKTATKDKKEQWIEDYFLQSTCYAIMLEEVYKDVQKIHIPQIAIVVAVEDGEEKQQLFVKKTSEYREKVLSFFADYHSKNPLPDIAVHTPSLFENLQ